VAQASWPSPAHNDREVTDLEYERLAARFSENGIYGTPADPAVVTAGVGLAVNVRADVYASVRGHAWASGSTGDTLEIAANSSGSTRIDRVVLRLDRSTWTVRAVVKTGTPGAGVPSLSQSAGDTGTYEIPLAEVTVLNGAASVTVTRKELYVGARLRPSTSTSRNPVPSPGEMCYETDTGRVRLWDGAAWVSALDDPGEVLINAPHTAWSNEADCVLQRRNGIVNLRLGSFKRTAGNLDAGTDSRLPAAIPAAYRHPTRDQYCMAYVTGARIARIIIYSAASERPGQVWLVNKPDISVGEFVLPSSGLSWAVA
jgi:hypothetical protein